MGGNLAKAPLVGVFYGAMLWFIISLLPRSAAYAEAAAAFTMPVSGQLFLLVAAVVFAAACAVAFSGARRGGIPFVAMLALTACGVQWAAPLLRQLLLGETTGVMTGGDTLFELLGGCAMTILALVLAALLYKTPDKATPGGKPPAETKYKLGVLGLVIRLLVLPFIFFLLYYLLWYFLFWRVDAAREFFGRAEKLNFMGEIIAILVDRGREAAVTLLVGLAYALFSLPLLFQMQGKRVLFIATNTLLYLTAALRYLIPTPVMPDAVRMAHLPETGLLLLLYGVITGLLLHTAFAKQEAAAAPGVPAKGAKPGAQPPAKPGGTRAAGAR